MIDCLSVIYRRKRKKKRVRYDCLVYRFKQECSSTSRYVIIDHLYTDIVCIKHHGYPTFKDHKDNASRWWLSNSLPKQYHHFIIARYILSKNLHHSTFFKVYNKQQIAEAATTLRYSTIASDSSWYSESFKHLQAQKYGLICGLYVEEVKSLQSYFDRALNVTQDSIYSSVVQLRSERTQTIS